MIEHAHLAPEEIFDRLSGKEALPGLAGCPTCEAEAEAARRLLSDLRLADTARQTSTDWDALVLRARIRDAVAREKPHGASWFSGFAILRPAFVSALVAVLALAAWSPLTRLSGSSSESPAELRVASHPLPAWRALPDVSEDEGLALLAEWVPNDDELAIARCRAACQGGLSAQEEENLLLAVSGSPALPPGPGPSPL